MWHDYLKLHGIVFIWGFTAILGVLISIPPVETVFYRTLIASIGLMFLCNHRWRLPWEAALKLFFTGTLVGLHWMLFFASVNVGSASVGLAGLSTVTLWTSLLEPVLMRRRFSLLEVALGVAVMLGLLMIFQFQTDQTVGLLFGIAAALVAAFFSIFNAMFVRNYHHLTITLYGMMGACAFSLVVIGVGTLWGRPATLVPTNYDVVWLLLLALVCTVYPYSASIELMKRLTVFATNLSINMEPVYGIILAAVILDEHKYLTAGFYAGTSIIIAAIVIYVAASHVRRRMVNPHPLDTPPLPIHPQSDESGS